MTTTTYFPPDLPKERLFKVHASHDEGYEPIIEQMNQAFGKGGSSKLSRPKPWYYTAMRVEKSYLQKGNNSGGCRNWEVYLYLTTEEQLSYCLLAFSERALP